MSQGVEETSKIWRPLVPQMGRRWGRSGGDQCPVFQLPHTTALHEEPASLPPYVFSFLCLHRVPSWGNGIMGWGGPIPSSPRSK